MSKIKEPEDLSKVVSTVLEAVHKAERKRLLSGERYRGLPIVIYIGDLQHAALGKSNAYDRDSVLFHKRSSLQGREVVHVCRSDYLAVHTGGVE